MPKGPNGQKRPADAIGLAVMIGRIATGEIEKKTETLPTRAGQQQTMIEHSLYFTALFTPARNG